MKNLKKKMVGLTSLVMALGTLGSSVNAATPQYYFNVRNTGQSFSYNDYANSNTKVYANEAWSFKVKTIEFTNGVAGYGMAFRLRKDSNGLVSSICWAPSTGSYLGGWGNGGPTGSYSIQARMDDDLSGACVAYGYWNADTIYNWPN